MAAATKSTLYVVVWEWQNSRGAWRPYSPEVSQLLERGYHKHLSSLLLGDADPRLAPYTVNLALLKQIHADTGERKEVRRTFLPHRSPPGSGVVWQWCGGISGSTDTADDADGELAERWHDYAMPVQCVVETAWAQGAQTVDISALYPEYSYVIDFGNLTQVNLGSQTRRAVRRQKQASYPVARPPHGYTYPGYDIPGLPMYDSCVGRREQRLKQQQQQQKQLKEQQQQQKQQQLQDQQQQQQQKASTCQNSQRLPKQPKELGPESELYGAGDSHDESAESSSTAALFLDTLPKPVCEPAHCHAGSAALPDKSLQKPAKSHKNDKAHTDKEKSAPRKSFEFAKSPYTTSTLLNKMLHFGLPPNHQQHNAINGRSLLARTRNRSLSPPPLPMRTHPPLQCSTPLPCAADTSTARTNVDVFKTALRSGDPKAKSGEGANVVSSVPSLAADIGKRSCGKNSNFFSRKHGKKLTSTDIPDSSARDNAINQHRASQCYGATEELPQMSTAHTSSSNDAGLHLRSKHDMAAFLREGGTNMKPLNRFPPTPLPRSILPPTPFPRTLLPSQSPPYVRVPCPEASPCPTSCSYDSTSLAGGRRASLETISTYLSTDDRAGLLHDCSDACIAHLVDFSMEEPEVFSLSIDCQSGAATPHYVDYLNQLGDIPDRALVPSFLEGGELKKLSRNSDGSEPQYNFATSNSSQKHKPSFSQNEFEQEKSNRYSTTHSQCSMPLEAQMSSHTFAGKSSAALQISQSGRDSLHINRAKDADCNSNSSHPPTYRVPNIVHLTALETLQYNNPENFLVPIGNRSCNNSSPMQANCQEQKECVSDRDSDNDDDDDVFTSADQEVRQVMSATIARTKVLMPPQYSVPGRASAGVI